MVRSVAEQSSRGNGVESVLDEVVRRSLIQEHLPLVERNTKRIPAEDRILQQSDHDGVEKHWADRLAPDTLLLLDGTRLTEHADLLLNTSQTEDPAGQAERPAGVTGHVEGLVEHVAVDAPELITE